jgi:hypothetical protein
MRACSAGNSSLQTVAKSASRTVTSRSVGEASPQVVRPPVAGEGDADNGPLPPGFTEDALALGLPEPAHVPSCSRTDGGLLSSLRMSQAAVQRAPARVDASVVTGGKPAPFPGFVEPCHPTLREEAPAGARWVADASERILFAEHLEGEGPQIQERAGAWV